MVYPQVAPIQTINNRIPQLVDGQGNNAPVRASDYNKMQFFLMNLDLLTDAADDTAAATAGVPVKGVYRNGSILMVRIS